MTRLLMALAALAMLVGCASVQAPFASEEIVRAKAYRHPGPASLTLITVINNRSGSGGHSALMINGSQRVIFDPAGSFQHAIVPEQNDVLFGITPAVFQGYRSAHARLAYHVETQTVEVTPEQAEIALQAARRFGAVPRSQCAVATSAVLRNVPGFQDIESGWFPTRLRDQFARIPGVVTEKYYEDDDGDILDGVARVQL